MERNLAPPLAPVSSGPEAPPTVLVVGQHLATRLRVQAALLRAGLQVETASDAQDALERAWSHDPAVVILDPGLPDGDGIEVAEALRALFGSHLPVVMLASAPPTDETAWRLEACDVLPASCEPAALLAAVHHALRGEQASVEAAIERLAHEWMAAAVQRNVVRLHQLVADDFTAISAEGVRLDKQRWLEEVLQRRPITAFTYRELAIRLYGEVALLQAAWTAHATELDGLERQRAGQLTDLWVKRDGVWQVVTRHLSLEANPLESSPATTWWP